jgi:hypothetical protein
MRFQGQPTDLRPASRRFITIHIEQVFLDKMHYVALTSIKCFALAWIQEGLHFFFLKAEMGWR